MLMLSEEKPFGIYLAELKVFHSLTWTPKGSFGGDNPPGPSLNLRFAQNWKFLSSLRAALPNENAKGSFCVCVNKTSSTYINYTLFLKEPGNRLESKAHLHLKMFIFAKKWFNSYRAIFRERITGKCSILLPIFFDYRLPHDITKTYYWYLFAYQIINFKCVFFFFYLLSLQLQCKPIYPQPTLGDYW